MPKGGRGMAWANWEATAATVAANAATAKHFDTNVGSPRWQQVEGRQERQKGGVVGAHISLAQATAKMPTQRQKKGRREGSRRQLGRQITNAIMKLI